jgi:amidohydrolase
MKRVTSTRPLSARSMPVSTDTLTTLLDLIDDELPEATELRTQLRQKPELAHQEHATSAAIRTALGDPIEHVAGTGLLARVGTGTNAVAVRAELDALPVATLTGGATDSRSTAAHTCGHDVHAAALVALTRAARRIAGRLPAPLLAIFQPSEETYPSGAELIVRSGALDEGVAAVVAAHVHPDVPWGSVAVTAGPINASCDDVEIIVEGQGTHGAYPHQGRDPVLAIAQIVVALHTVVPRRIDPTRAAVVSVGQINAGSAANVVPDQATATATLRALDPTDRATLRDAIEEITSGIAKAHGCSVRLHLTSGEPALCNDVQVGAETRALAPHAGLTVTEGWTSCGADDLAYYGTKARLLMAFTGLAGAPGFLHRPLHHPGFDPPADAVGAVARTNAVLYVAASTAVGRLAVAQSP